MTPEERQLVDGLFARIRANPPAERDPEAERLIRDLVARDANAAYAMVQMTLVQEHALRLAEERIRQLEQAAPPPSSGRSFLGGMLPTSGQGSGGQRAGSVPASGSVWGGGAGAAAPPPFPGQAAPPPYPGQAAPQASRGGSFLRTALGTAAGVAGGALLFQGISSLFQHSPGPFGSGSGLLGGQAAAATPPAGASPWGGGGAAHDPALDKPYADDKFADDKFADEKDKGYAPDDGGPNEGGPNEGGPNEGGPNEGGYDPNADAQQDYGDDSDGGGGNDDWSNT